MKVIKYPEKTVTCTCGAVLSYTDEDVKYNGNNFFHEVEEYIECPCCERRITLRTSSSCGRPYD